MPDENILKLIQEGSLIWNRWRMNNPNVEVDLSGADLTNANLAETNLSNLRLSNANLSEAKLTRANLDEARLSNADLTLADLSEATLSNAYLVGANLSKANLYKAGLSGAELTYAILNKTRLVETHFYNAKLIEANLANADLGKADCTFANFSRANLSGANLSGANLSDANLSKVNLTGADLTGANLQNAILVETNIVQTILKNCTIYGLSAWALKGKPADQSNLVITPFGEAKITVDDLQVAQFIYLLLNHENLRNLLETITSKAVLILGRFTPERKHILDAIAEELRKHNLLPIIFDFERASSRDFTETIKILAGMSLFVIADITNPSSSPLELQATIPDYKIPFVPIIQEGNKPFAMLSDLIGKYNWVLEPVITYPSLANLLAAFKPAIIDRAWNKRQELQKQKTSVIETLSIDSYINKSTTE